MLLLLVFVSLPGVHAVPDASLAPFRAAAHKAYAAEVEGAARDVCPNLIALPEYAICLDKALHQSEANFADYRTALHASLEARSSVLGVQAVKHFETTEQAWDVYSAGEAKAASDMGNTPVLGAGIEVVTRIDLIRDHMRILDKLYYTLLHDDCGACLVNH